MVTYLLRAIPAPLWGRVKARAAADGVSIRVVLLRLLERYADHGHR